MTDEEWAVLNAERGRLIDTSIAFSLTASEQARLDKLNEIAEEHLKPIDGQFEAVLDQLEAKLKGGIV